MAKWSVVFGTFGRNIVEVRPGACSTGNRGKENGQRLRRRGWL